MEIITLILGIVGILLLLITIFILLFKNGNHNLLQHLTQLNTDTREKNYENFNTFTDRMDSRIQELSSRNVTFEKELSKDLDAQFNKLQEKVENQLIMIDRRVTENLEEGFKKTNLTFTSIVERLSKIDEAQKKIDSLNVEIVSLQNVLTDKRARGAFGEVQLNQILTSIFGDKNDKIYQTQYSFATHVRADAVLFAPEPLGTLAIDSKFPLENYRRLTDQTLSTSEREQATKQFIADCRKHIDDIANKYIIPKVTSDQALMFIPAEAVFAYITAYHQDLINYAQSRRVWLVSPTTLMSTLTTIQTILVNMEREKYASVIQEQLRLLNVEFERYRDRWDKLSANIDSVSKGVKDIHVTTGKITKRFESIANVEEKSFEKLDHQE